MSHDCGNRIRLANIVTPIKKRDVSKHIRFEYLSRRQAAKAQTSPLAQSREVDGCFD